MRHDLHLHKGAFKVSYSFWTLKVTVSRRSKALACKLSNNTTNLPQPTYHVPLPSKQRAAKLWLVQARILLSAVESNDCIAL